MIKPETIAKMLDAESESLSSGVKYSTAKQASKEIRRLHAENERLRAENESMAKRLQEIEQQEPVSWQFYQNDQWSHGSEYHNHRENTEQGGIPVRDLYALPVSPEGWKEWNLLASSLVDGIYGCRSWIRCLQSGGSTFEEVLAETEIIVNEGRKKWGELQNKAMLVAIEVNHD